MLAGSGRRRRWNFSSVRSLEAINCTEKNAGTSGYRAKFHRNFSFYPCHGPIRFPCVSDDRTDFLVVVVLRCVVVGFSLVLFTAAVVVVVAAAPAELISSSFQPPVFRVFVCLHRIRARRVCVSRYPYAFAPFPAISSGSVNIFRVEPSSSSSRTVSHRCRRRRARPAAVKAAAAAAAV